MRRIFISGLVNVETTLKVDGFPIDYQPVRYPFYDINSTVAGVGYNISKALSFLGNGVRFASLIGKDAAGALVLNALNADGIAREGVLVHGEHTAQSVILYGPDGKRAIFTDLKDIQESTYPLDTALQTLKTCDLAALCNINFSRALLQPTRDMGIPIATDVHAIRDLDDVYNRDFLAAANILFCSHENLHIPPAEWARASMARFGNEVIVIGMGEQGALLCVRDDGFVGRLPALHTREIVSTIGAGDALFSAFVHTYARTRNPYESLQRAIVFASWKIGTAGAAQGFLNAPAWDALYRTHQTALTFQAP